VSSDSTSHHLSHEEDEFCSDKPEPDKQHLTKKAKKQKKSNKKEVTKKQDSDFDKIVGRVSSTTTGGKTVPCKPVKKQSSNSQGGGLCRQLTSQLS